MTTTHAQTRLPRPPNLVNRVFTVTRPNELWVSDFTYVAAWWGFVYVAFVIDVFARRIVGRRVSASLCADFVLDALEQAIYDRCRDSAPHKRDLQRRISGTLLKVRPMRDGGQRAA